MYKITKQHIFFVPSFKSRTRGYTTVWLDTSSSLNSLTLGAVWRPVCWLYSVFRICYTKDFRHNVTFLTYKQLMIILFFFYNYVLM